MAGPKKKRTMQDREAWALAAWASMATRGEVSFSIEGLAPTLGVTKGSFYWHFDDRRDLLREVLAMFEKKGAHEPIEALSKERDPRRRIAMLFETALDESVNLRGERCLYTSPDPDVVEVVARVHALRRAFLDDAYRALGLTAAVAARFSATAYATYLGAVQLSDQPPFDDDRTLRAWTRHVATLLVPAV